MLLSWHRKSNKRQMPWKGEKDPYKIWLSEVILQQTRVGQGWNYYERFVAAYPDVKQLALAKDEDVFKLWEWLGYYNRCKNLLFTARQITGDRQGKFRWAAKRGHKPCHDACKKGPHARERLDRPQAGGSPGKSWLSRTTASTARPNSGTSAWPANAMPPT